MRTFKKFYLLAMVAAMGCGQPDMSSDSMDGPVPHPVTISTGNIMPVQLTSYARTLIGIPYKYGSINPAQGFDCSGFITYVFNHFGINVPRTSVDFTLAGEPVNLKEAKAGDLILFTGTDTTGRIVGHMGIITTQPGQDIKFLHSTSGRQDGVTETPLNQYYMVRYVKTVRVFVQNGL
jgi:cell wall-associated NlpC family hydrolase